jgi:hypothetical protein
MRSRHSTKLRVWCTEQEFEGQKFPKQEDRARINLNEKDHRGDASAYVKAVISAPPEQENKTNAREERND